MSHNTNRAAFAAWFSEISKEENRFACQSSNFQTVSKGEAKENDNLAERDEEFQHVPMKEREGKNHKTQAGFFSRLRNRLGLGLKELPEAGSSSSVRAIHNGEMEIRRDSLIIVQKTTTPCYLCVPYPPGCIPTEVMLKVENEQGTKKLNFLGCPSGKL